MFTQILVPQPIGNQSPVQLTQESSNDVTLQNLDTKNVIWVSDNPGMAPGQGFAVGPGASQSLAGGHSFYAICDGSASAPVSVLVTDAAVPILPAQTPARSVESWFGQIVSANGSPAQNPVTCVNQNGGSTYSANKLFVTYAAPGFGNTGPSNGTAFTVQAYYSLLNYTQSLATVTISNTGASITPADISLLSNIQHQVLISMNNPGSGGLGSTGTFVNFMVMVAPE